ncbi:MAG: hypothetical protein JWO83_2069 [Caulobacteraceae bacterium]|nr:hypothetical protein [Caulobacteraceae bacterium]
MSVTETFPPADANPEAAPEPVAVAIARAERRLAMLARLAELGMQLVEKLTERAVSDSDREPKHDPGQSFARASRAVRLSLALEAKFEQDLAALREGRAPTAPAVDPDAWTPPDDPGRKKTRDHPSAHRNRVRDNVWDVINHETSITDLLPSYEVLDDLHERLTEGERYDSFLYRPLRESVEAICKDLGLTFDASRWTEDGFPPDERTKRCDWPSMWRPDPKRVEARRLARAEALAVPPPPTPAPP